MPDELREAAYALGIPKWKTILRIVLPTALSGTVTGVMLALARVMGETAPVLVLVGYSQSINFDPFSGNMASLPLLMFSELSNPEPSGPVPHLGRRADAHPHHHDPAARGERRVALLRHLEVEEHRGQATGPEGRRHLLRRLPRRAGRQPLGVAAQRHLVHRPVGLRQVDRAPDAEPDARGDPRRPRRRRGAARRRGHLRPQRRRGGRAPHHRHGLPAPQPVPDDVDPRQRGGRPEAPGRARQEEARRGRRGLAARREPLEGGQGPPRQARRQPLRWSAAAPVHRPRDRRPARRAAHGRAVLGARPDLDAGDRGPHRGPQEGVHDRHRHPQHAAGGAGERPDGLLQPRGHRQARQAGRDRRHREDLLEPAPRRPPRTTSPAASAESPNAKEPLPPAGGRGSFVGALRPRACWASCR